MSLGGNVPFVYFPSLTSPSVLHVTAAIAFAVAVDGFRLLMDLPL